MKKISQIILTGLAPITALTTASLATSCNPQQSDEPLIHDSDVFFRTPNLAKTITVIDLGKVSNELKDDFNTTFQSLQGLIVQEKQQAELFVCSGVLHRDKWLYDMQNKYHFGIDTVSEIDIKDDAQDIWDVLDSYKDLFNSKYVKYTKAINEESAPTRDNISVNNATMISACEHYLMVSDKLLEKFGDKLEAKGITQASPSIDPEKPAYEVFTHFKDQLDKHWLLNQDPVDFALRDYAIAAKMPVVCVGLEEDHRDEIAAAMEPNSPIYGWTHGFNGEISDCGPEQDYLIWSTTHKLNVLASDHCYNLSFYSYDKPDKAYKQHEHKKLVANPNKHYLAIVMSDGDNIQWMQNDFLWSPEYWGSPYRGSFPLSWTISPTPIDMNNSILEQLYSTATDNDEIIAGPSGYAYINPAWYNQDDLMPAYQDFAKRTAQYMHDCDMTIANPLDYKYPNWHEEVPTDPNCMIPYMQQDQIKGLIWSLDGLSLAGHGSVHWINDKPLLSFREGIWDNPKLHQADILARLKNEYPRDIHRIDGYTALVVNVWGPEGKMDKLKEFVEQLPDDVELVTISQLLQLISDNVPHVDATPEKYPDKLM